MEMKLPVKIAIAVTAFIVIFTSGFFIGRSTDREIIISPMASSPVKERPSLTLDMMSDDLSEKININTASSEELCSLSGIGETLSERIVKYRSEHGPFSSIEEIMNVDGIGDSKFLAIKDYITVGD